MDLLVQIKINEKLYLKDPQTSELGKNILQSGVLLMADLGFEEFTFKKLATAVNTTEASIYRYFENKHRFLLYIVNLYWHLLEFQVNFATQNMSDPKEKIERIIRLLTEGVEKKVIYEGIDLNALYAIVVMESNRVYLTRAVEKDNKNFFFRAYKNLCGTISEIITMYDPEYPFARSLSSTLIEMSHLQHFFMQNLPSLTNLSSYTNDSYLKDFLRSLVFDSLKTKS